MSSAGWAVLSDGRGDCPGQSVDGDLELLQAVHDGALGPTIRLWENRECLVVTRREFEVARRRNIIDRMEAEGWPVVPRLTGGTTVTNGPGVLNVSMIFRDKSPAPAGPGHAYQMLYDLISEALQRFGLRARLGQIDGAYCRGGHDISVGGRKIAGTAQRVRQTGAGERRWRTVLVHAALLVNVDLDEMARAINNFYDLCDLSGSIERVKADRCTTVSQALGREAAIAEMKDCLIGTVSDQFSAVPGRSRLGGTLKRVL